MKRTALLLIISAIALTILGCTNPSSGGSAPVNWTISFDANGNDDVLGSMDSVSVADGSSFEIPACGYARNLFTFSHWVTTREVPMPGDPPVTPLYPNDKINSVNGNIVLYAVWTDNPRIVSFNANGGVGSMDSVSVPYNESYTLPSCGFTLTGHSFSGWQDKNGGNIYDVGASVVVTSDLEFAAIWVADPAISFDPGASDYTGSMDTVTVPYKGSFTVPDCGFTRAGYTFSRWVDGNGHEWLVGGTMTNLTSDTMLTALWNRNPSISFSPGGADGGSMSNTSVAYGASYAVPDCGYTRARYTFLHWRDGNGLTYQAGQKVVLTGDIVFTAVWQIVPRVTFHPNGESGTAPVKGFMNSVDVQYGGSYTIPASGYTRRTYRFSGWNTAAGGGGISYSAGASIGSITADLDLYAQWTRNPNVIKYIGFDEGLSVGQLFDTVQDNGSTIEIVSDAPQGADGKALRAQLTEVHLLDTSIRGEDRFDDFWLVYDYYLEYTNGVVDTFPQGSHVPLVIVLDSTSSGNPPKLIGTPLFNVFEYSDPVAGLSSIRTLTTIENLQDRVLGYMHTIETPAGTWHRVKIHIKTDSSLAGISITFDGVEWNGPVILDGSDPDASFDTLRLWYHVPDNGPLYRASNTVLYFDNIGVYAADPDSLPD